MVDIDLNNKSWYPIYNFEGTFNGNGHIITNINILGRNINSEYYYGIFAMLGGGANIKNLTLDYNNTAVTVTNEGTYVGGLVGYVSGDDVVIDNVHIYNHNVNIECTTGNVNVGGIVGYASYTTLSNNSVNNSTITSQGSMDNIYAGSLIGRAGSETILTSCNAEGCIIDCSDTTFSYYDIGGVAGEKSSTSTWEKLYSDTYIDFSNCSGVAYIGGIAGYAFGGLNTSRYSGTINSQASSGTINCGGIVGIKMGANTIVTRCMFDGKLKISTGAKSYVGGIIGVGAFIISGEYSCTYCLSKGEILFNLTAASTSYIGGIAGGSTDIYCSYSVGASQISCTSTDSSYSSSITSGAVAGNCSVGSSFGDGELHTTVGSRKTTGELTTSEIKSRDTYTYTYFETYWYISANVNNGYPILRDFISIASVTDFSGNGTEDSPYQISTQAELLGMASYYNDYDIINEYYWILMNDLDISLDANSIKISWTPIGYEDGVILGFNGHFDGNGKTISGLTITEQYENVGLFGRIASNATITNLNVTGTIAWDQATNVGGVVGLMEDGAMLTNCTFSGTITGYLNSGNYAIVGGLAGKYSTDAITGNANYDTYVYGTNNYVTFNRYTTQYSSN